MTAPKTRKGLKEPVDGAPHAHWRVNLKPTNDSIAFRRVEYPESGDRGDAIQFAGMAFLLPDREEIWVIPARGCSWSEEQTLFRSVIGRRNTQDLSEVFKEDFVHPRFGSVQSARFWNTHSVARCDVQGCSSFNHWHQADREFRITEKHVADGLRGDGYEVLIVHDGEHWVPQIRLDYDRNGKPMSVRSAHNLNSDLTWLLAEVNNLNSSKEVHA